ncbi:MAG: methylenetetrahydrofolate reductase [Thermodesulfobacteriota bacterium]|nr:methylenetetrahydrofolate reductase [Thermodesulfobacteriota bacterium]
MPLREKIKSGEFILLGEFQPPKGIDFASLLKDANRVKGRLSAIVVPEMANAVLRASSLGGCAYLRNHGLETILQVCCRDRNRLAIQADLLAAGALGIRNIMVVPDEDITHGDHPHARAVNDLDLLELLEMLQRLQSGKDMAGIELRGVPKFCVGTTVNTGAPGGLLEIEIENLKKKMDLGVEYIITNPIFDIHQFQQFLKRINPDTVAVIPTVLLLKSAGMARYISRNVKNISIPSEMIREIQKATDKPMECIQIAGDLINHLKNLGMAGVLISTVGWEDRLPLILDRVKT